MKNVIDINHRLTARRTLDYASGEDAVISACLRVDEMLSATTGQLLVPVDDIFSALSEVRAILRAEATWPDDAPTTQVGAAP